MNDSRPSSPTALPAASPQGHVYLIGAGPGDAGLITLRGVECLRRAEVVLYDYLVNPDILQHCSPHAERICLGKHGRQRLWTQEEINARLVAEGRQGKIVARLKSGDPAIFARYAEEVAAIAAANLTWEMVPGVTTAIAASSFAGIPLTHREQASAVALITAREDDCKADSALDYAALARFPGTLVFYMGVTSAPQWTQALIAAGKSAATPAAIVRRCSWPDQRVCTGTLGDIAGRIAAEKMRPPVIVIVGDVVNLAPVCSWFDRRPLYGQTVLVTRAQDQAEGLAAPLRDLGAEVLTQSAIEIGPPPDPDRVREVVARLAAFDTLVFSSANGVASFFQAIAESGRDLRAIGGAQLAAIGPGTAAELARWRLRADVTPNEHRAEALVAALAPTARGKRFLLVRASRGREVLAEGLAAAGGDVTQVVTYASRDVATPLPEIAERLGAGGIDWVTVTSSAIARSLVRLFGENLRRTRLVSISPITTQALAELGHTPAAEAKTYTMAGVVEAIRGAEYSRS